MSHTVLIADNHDLLRRRIRALLEREGLDVCGEAANGLEAIQMVTDYSPRVVILNISMPVLGGLEALPEIIRCSPTTKVLMFTVDDAEELRRRAFDLGASAFLSKSSPVTDLLTEIRRLLGQ